MSRSAFRAPTSASSARGASTEKSTCVRSRFSSTTSTAPSSIIPAGLIPFEWRIHTQIHRDRPDAHVRLPSACAACARARHRRQAAGPGVPARLVPVHRRADLEQSAPGDERRSGRRPFARARRASGGADARSRQCRCRRHRTKRRSSPARSSRRTRKFSSRRKSWAAPLPLDDEARDCAEGTFNPRLFDLLWTFYERKVRLRLSHAARSIRMPGLMTLPRRTRRLTAGRSRR